MNINQKIYTSSLNSAKQMIEELSNEYNNKKNLFNMLAESLKNQQWLSDSLNLEIKRINEYPLNSLSSTVTAIKKSSNFLLVDNLRNQQWLSGALNLAIKRVNEHPLNSLSSSVKAFQKSSFISLAENLKNQQSLSDTLNLAIKRVNEYPLNSFSSTVKAIQKSSGFSFSMRSYNKMISEALKYDNIKIPLESITLELPKIEDVILVSKPHMPEKVQEEIELEFDEYFKENNEIINNSILDMESIRKIILNRYLNFLLSILVLMIQFYSDDKVYHLLINAVFLIHSFFLSSDKSK
ncbi:hypothetical protein [Gemella sanguinis]|jgi:hypothetical protein|uniref:hypothetical protein n=1 Tax=Gemella sanguinis TaxID=84135 RepID=UPI0004E0C6E1|nr:hypothetical protein [Gemella sanguinis]NKZ25362.1 hypothetical protein [Gemella sanguinis]